MDTRLARLAIGLACLLFSGAGLLAQQPDVQLKAPTFAPDAGHSVAGVVLSPALRAQLRQRGGSITVQWESSRGRGVLTRSAADPNFDATFDLTGLDPGPITMTATVTPTGAAPVTSPPVAATLVSAALSIPATFTEGSVVPFQVIVTPDTASLAAVDFRLLNALNPSIIVLDQAIDPATFAPDGQGHLVANSNFTAPAAQSLIAVAQVTYNTVDTLGQPTTANAVATATAVSTPAVGVQLTVVPTPPAGPFPAGQAVQLQATGTSPDVAATTGSISVKDSLGSEVFTATAAITVTGPNAYSLAAAWPVPANAGGQYFVSYFVQHGTLTASATEQVTVTALAATLALTQLPASITVGVPFQFGIVLGNVPTLPSGAAISGTVADSLGATITAFTVPLTSLVPDPQVNGFSAVVALTLPASTPAGTAVITAVYSVNGTTVASTTSAAIPVAQAPPPALTIVAAPSTVVAGTTFTFTLALANAQAQDFSSLTVAILDPSGSTLTAENIAAAQFAPVGGHLEATPTFAVPATVPPGANDTFSATFVDVNGRISTATQPISVVATTTALFARTLSPIFTGLPQGAFFQAVLIPQVGNVGSVSFHFTNATGATAPGFPVWSVPAASLTPTTYNGVPAWAIPVSFIVPAAAVTADTQVTLHCDVADTSGLTLATTSTSVVVKPDVAPAVAISSPRDGAIYTNQRFFTPNYSASVSGAQQADGDSVTSVVATVDTADPLYLYDGVPFDLTTITPGAHYAIVRADDAAGLFSINYVTFYVQRGAVTVGPDSPQAGLTHPGDQGVPCFALRFERGVAPDNITLNRLVLRASGTCDPVAEIAGVSLVVGGNVVAGPVPLAADGTATFAGVSIPLAQNDNTDVMAVVNFRQAAVVGRTLTLSASPADMTLTSDRTGNVLPLGGPMAGSALTVASGVPPVVAIASPLPKVYPDFGTLQLRFSATDRSGAGLASVVGSLDGGPAQDAQVIDLGNFPVGPHVLRVTATDKARNVTVASVAFSVGSPQQALSLLIDDARALLSQPNLSQAARRSIQEAIDLLAGSRPNANNGAMQKLRDGETEPFLTKMQQAAERLARAAQQGANTAAVQRKLADFVQQMLTMRLITIEIQYGALNPVVARARQLFFAGQTAFQAGDYAGAIEQFRLAELRILPLDTDGPEVTFASPGPGQVFQTGAVLVNVRYVDQVGIPDRSTFRATLDGRDVTNAFTTDGFQATASLNVLSGTHTLSVSIQDRNGNVGRASQTFFYDLRLRVQITPVRGQPLNVGDLFSVLVNAVDTAGNPARITGPARVAFTGVSAPDGTMPFPPDLVANFIAGRMYLPQVESFLAAGVQYVTVTYLPNPQLTGRSSAPVGVGGVCEITREPDWNRGGGDGPGVTSQVTDDFGNPLSIPVTFTIIGGGAIFTGGGTRVIVTPNARGFVTTPDIRFGQSPAVIQVAVGGASVTYTMGPPAQGPVITPFKTHPPDVTPARTSQQPPPNHGASGGEPIDLFTGEEHEEAVDLDIPSRGFDFAFTRYYSNKIQFDGLMGQKWDHSYNTRLRVEPNGDVTLSHACRLDRFTASGGGGFTSPQGIFMTLAREAGGYVLREPHGMENHFDSDGRLASIRDRNGNQMDFLYNVQGQLDHVLDTLGRKIEFFYSPEGHLIEVRDFAKRSIVFGYDPDHGDLVSVRSPIVVGTPNGNDFPGGRTVRYTYHNGCVNPDLNHNLLTMTDAKRQLFLVNVYDAENRVSKQWYGTGVFTFDYDDVLRTTRHKDRRGTVTEYAFNALGNPVRQTVLTRGLRPGDPASFTTTWEYNGDGLRTKITYPRGNSVDYTYDSANPDRLAQANLTDVVRNAGPVPSDQASIKFHTDYEPRFQFPKRITDPRDGGVRGRFTTTFVFDYETGAGNAGNVVEIDFPNVTVGLGAPQGPRSKMAYNTAGQQLSAEDPEGNVTTYLYYPQDDPSGLANPNARTQAPGGYLAETVVDGVNNGNRSEAAPLADIHNSWTYDLVGNPTSSKDGNGNVTTYFVNALNEVVRATSAAPFSYVNDTFYDANGNVERVVAGNDPAVPGEPVNYTTSYEYEILNNVIAVLREVGGGVTLSTAFKRNENESVEEYTAPERNVVRTLYDERDLPVSVTRGFGARGASTTKCFVDANGNTSRVETGLGHPTSTEHDGFGRVRTVTDAAGGQARLRYDAASDVLSALFYGTEGGPSPQDQSGSRNALLASVTTLYDELSRAYEVDQAYFDVRTGARIGSGTARTRRRFDRDGRVTQVVNDNGHSVFIGYDGASRRVSARDAGGDEVDVTYDKDSNPGTVVEREVPSGGGRAISFTTTNLFDELDRLFQSTDNAGHVRQLKWDSRGNRVKLTDAEGNVTRSSYDGLDRMTQVQRELRDALGRATGTITTKRHFDGNSRLDATTDDSGNVTQYHWDALDRLEEVIYADRTANRWTLTLDDRPETETDQNGTFVKNTYDALDRPTERIVAPARDVATTTTREEYEWDGLSRMTKGRNDASTVEMAYDSLSRVIEETQNGRSIRTVRDGVGNPVTCQYPGGRTIGRQFDVLERVREIDDGAGRGASMLAQYTYNGPSRPGTRTLGNRITETCLYDDDRRITSKAHARPADGGIVCGWEYDYNREDQKLFERQLHPSSQGPAGSGEVFAYDSLYRLGTVKYGVADPAQEAARPGSSSYNRQVSYGLDGVGNWTGETVTNGQGGLISFIQPVADAMNQYTSFGQASETQDKNGNRTSFATPNSSQFVTYDFRNRPVAVYSSRNGALALVASYTYDVLNRRIEKNAAGQGDVRFFYSGWQCVEEQDRSGATLATYVDGPQYVDEHVSMDRGGQRYYYCANTLYSVGALTDSRGNVVERYSYDVYGTPTIENPDGTSSGRNASAFGNPFLFTGQRFDPETGFYYARNNYLDPLTGRWISHDPLGSDRLGSLYGYCGGNPVSNVDPMGLSVFPSDRNAWQEAKDAAEEAMQAGDQDAYASALAEWQRATNQLMEHDRSAIWGGSGEADYYFRVFNAAPRDLPGQHVNAAQAEVLVKVGQKLGATLESTSSDLDTAVEVCEILDKAGTVATFFAGGWAISNAVKAGATKVVAVQLGKATVIAVAANGGIDAGGTVAVALGADEQTVAFVTAGAKAVVTITFLTSALGEGGGQSTTAKVAPGAGPASKGGIGPVLKGQAGVERAIAEIEAEGGTILGREITIEAGGVRTRPDLYVKTAAGKTQFVEVKNGPGAGLTTNQKVAFPAIESTGGIPRGGNAAAAGLPPGEPIPPTPVEVRRYR